VDGAILVVSGADGPMPQTREHVLSVVISAKSETVWNRRPGDVGLRFLTAISDSKQIYRIAFGDFDDGALDVLAPTDRVATALALAFAVHRVDP